MSTCVAPPVYVLRVPHVQRIKSSCKRLILLRYTYKMHMVIHQTIGPDIKPVFATVGLQPFQILSKILVVLKDSLPVIASLGDMMRISFCNGSGYSWHAATLLCNQRAVNQIMGAVPILSNNHPPQCYQRTAYKAPSFSILMHLLGNNLVYLLLIGGEVFSAVGT